MYLCNVGCLCQSICGYAVVWVCIYVRVFLQSIRLFFVLPFLFLLPLPIPCLHVEGARRGLRIAHGYLRKKIFQGCMYAWLITHTPCVSLLHLHTSFAILGSLPILDVYAQIRIPSAWIDSQSPLTRVSCLTGPYSSLPRHSLFPPFLWITPFPDSLLFQAEHSFPLDLKPPTH